MIYRMVGAGLILLSCGGFGFYIAAQYRKEICSFRNMITMLDLMEWELSYRSTCLPDLCRKTANIMNNNLSAFLNRLAVELENQICPDVVSCIGYVLPAFPRMPGDIKLSLKQLGMSLGRFDLEGQLKGIASVRQSCKEKLKQLEGNRDARIRSYQTLGICTGAALVILFI